MLGVGFSSFALAVRRLLGIAPPPVARTWDDAAVWNDAAVWSDTQ